MLAAPEICRYSEAVQPDPFLSTPSLLTHVPVFPLPNTVLFPGVMLPLHIVETRYQQMLNDVMAGSQQVVISCVPPGTEGRVAAVGCLARIMQVERQPGGRANILLRGEDRVRLLEETTGSTPYLRFRAQRLPRPAMQASRHHQQAFGLLQQMLRHLGSAAARMDKQLAEVMRASSDPITTADFLAASLVRDVARQQAVLESHDLCGQISGLIDGLAEALLKLVGEELAANARD